MTWKCTNTAKGDNKLYSDAKGVVPSLDLRFAEGKTLNDYMTGQQLIQFSRSSIGTYVDENGIIQTAIADQPRFDHDPTTGESLGLLIEESRTNEVSYSTITTANWGVVDGATITDNQAIAPDGTNTAALINFPASGGPRISITTSNASGVRTVSCWVRAVSGTVTIRIGNGSDFGLNQTIGTEWTRIYEEVPSSSNSAGIYCSNPVSVAQFYAWGFQQEAGSFPTSYIPTTGTALTRSADVASITGSNFSSWYNQSEGTVLSDSDIIALGQTQAVWQLAGGTYPTSLRQPNSTGAKFRALIGGSLTPGTGVTLPGVTKAAVSFSGTAGRLQVGASGVDTTTFGVLNPNALNIGTFTTGSQLNGTIARITYFPERLPDSTLQAITQ